MEESIRRNAELVIEHMQDQLGVDLSYDEESVAWLDKYIVQIRENLSEELTDKLITVLGSFFGECIRRRFGGEWRLTNGQWAIVFDDRNSVFPFAKTGKHFQSEGESILGLYKTILVVFKDVLKSEPAFFDASDTIPEMSAQEAHEIASLLDVLRSHEYTSRKYRRKGDVYYEIGDQRFSMEYHNLAAEEDRHTKEISARLEERLGPAGRIPAPDPEEMLTIRMKAEELGSPWSGEKSDFDEACFCARNPRWTRFNPELWRAYEKWKDDPRLLQEAPRFMPADPSWEH